MAWNPDSGTHLLFGRGKDWPHLEELLVDRGLMVCDAAPLAPERTFCTACRLASERVVMRGPWAGLERADLHFRICPGCGSWVLLSTCPASISSR